MAPLLSAFPLVFASNAILPTESEVRAMCMEDHQTLLELAPEMHSSVEHKCIEMAPLEAAWIREGRLTIYVDKTGCAFLDAHGSSAQVCIPKLPPSITTLKVAAKLDSDSKLLQEIADHLKSLGLKAILLKTVQENTDGA